MYCDITDYETGMKLIKLYVQGQASATVTQRNMFTDMQYTLLQLNALGPATQRHAERAPREGPSADGQVPVRSQFGIAANLRRSTASELKLRRCSRPEWALSHDDVTLM